MHEFCTEIEIQASDTRVWQLLTDFANFPQWNPFIHRAKGEAKVGIYGEDSSPLFLHIVIEAKNSGSRRMPITIIRQRRHSHE